MEQLEIKNVFLEKRIAKRIKNKIGNCGFITQIDEVSSKKIGGADFFRVVLYTSELIDPIEKIIKSDVKWETKE